MAGWKADIARAKLPHFGTASCLTVIVHDSAGQSRAQINPLGGGALEDVHGASADA